MTMASGGSWKNNICPQCGQMFEILNGDVQFSMALHLQSHKSLDKITQEIDQQMKNVKVGPKNQKKWDYTCPECKENVIIFNNDVTFSLKLHAEKHKSSRVESKSEDQSSTSSVKSKGSEKKIKTAVNSPSVPDNIKILDGIFDSMPLGLKLHRGFVTENENGKAVCNICKVTVDSMFNVAEHLKTKSHEDKTITFLTNMLPTELRHVMEFVSFYGSNLCCNLCRNKIELCSENPYKTIINIMAHNSSKGHLQYKTNDESICNSDGASMILKSLSNINPAVNSNKHHIECKMQPQFKCKLCDKTIAYDQNEKILYQNFDSHFSTKGHIKCVEASSVFVAFNLSQFPGKERHNLIVSKGNIYCTKCNCNIEVNLQQLISHVKQVPKSEMQANTQTPSLVKEVAENLTPFKSLLNSLPPQLKNTTCLVEGNQGHINCLVCDTGIPGTVYNLTTHLLGKSHKSKAEGKPAVEKTNKQGGNALTEDMGLLKNLFEEIPISFRKHMKFIQCVNKEKLHCSICKYDVPAHSKYLEDHLQSTLHMKSLAASEFNKVQEQKQQRAASKNVLLDKLKKSDVFVKNCAKFMIVNGDHYKCRQCDSIISSANEEKTLKADILAHINGKKHKTSIHVQVYDTLLDQLEISDPFVKAERQFLQKQHGSIFCNLCSCSVSAATEFQSFKINLLSHLTGSQHNSNKLNVNQRNAAPSFTSAPRNDSLNNPTKIDFLKSFPARYQDDIAFLKPSSAEGFLSCILCNNIINPQYLREHLEDVQHIQNKSLRRTMTTPNQNEEQAVVKNMGTLINLLGSIDKKLSWPAK